MRFRNRNLRELAEIIIGDNDRFPYRSSSYITEFFEECDLEFVHDGSTRWAWTSDRLAELLNDSQDAPNTLPSRFVHVLRVLMHKADAADDDPDRRIALSELNKPLNREGYEAFYDEDDLLNVRHQRTQDLSITVSPHRAFTPEETRRRVELEKYLDLSSEDALIEDVLLPLFRQLGFQRVSAAGHKDKSLEYGKDVWMRYTLPTQHVIYFGIQAKRGKLDAAGRPSPNQGSKNIAEVYHQVLMMLGHDIFDPETSKRVLVDHAFIVAGGEITKAARNWLGSKLDATKRSQILFLDREDILNLYTVSRLALPPGAAPKTSGDGDDQKVSL